MEFRKMKTQARLYASLSRPSPMLVTAVYAGLCAIFAYVSVNMILGNFDFSSMFQYYEKFGEYVKANDIEGAMNVTDKIMALYTDAANAIKTYEVIACALVALLIRILTSGHKIYALSVVHNSSPCFGNLLDGFSPRIIAVDMIAAILECVGLLLFVVPGIILFYSYRQAVYIAAENPDKGIVECLRESRKTMKGQKAQLFKLDMSMIGWIIVCRSEIFGYFAYLTMVWVKPFTAFTYVMYYDSLFHPGMEHRIDPPETKDGFDD